MANPYKIVTSLSTRTYKKIASNGAGKSPNNTILMGSYVRLLNEDSGNYTKVTAFGTEGWVKKEDLGDSPGLKIFYVDVGQGDGALLEVGNDDKGLKILIDGGPGDNLSSYLNKWQYKYYLNKGKKVHIDYVFISHFDKDHYGGLIDIINDGHYTFGTIYHSGIAKFNNDKDDFPAEYGSCELGKKVKMGKEWFLETNFDSLDELIALREKGGMLNLLEKFSFALENAKDQGRLQNVKRLDHTSPPITHQINNLDFDIEILGPVPSVLANTRYMKYFKDEAHTINGHSLVLKIKYGKRTFLFGGDLNTDSEEHLLEHYGNANPFEVDVAKSCHHGASEFTIDFMKSVNPFATVISSGDNESYSHPRADAIGCAGKYTKSDRPLVFSTELARSTNLNANTIKFGMINLRCNGKKIIMAQMKEVAIGGNVWDLYEEGLS